MAAGTIGMCHHMLIKEVFCFRVSLLLTASLLKQVQAEVVRKDYPQKEKKKKIRRSVDLTMPCQVCGEMMLAKR